MNGQQQIDLAGPIPDPPDKPHSAQLAWTHAYRDRLPRKGLFLKHKDRIPIVRWCVSHQDIFRANSLASFAEELRVTTLPEAGWQWGLIGAGARARLDRYLRK